MGRKKLSQEGLKAIACGAMLLDHIGAVFLPGVALRCIGRISFPIFCFLLAEGANHTRSPGKYALRLALGALIAEIPYDGLLYGGFCREHQNVMFTLLLGLLTLRSMERWPGFGLLSLMAGCLLAELGHTSYGGWGVAMVVLFGRTARLPRRELWQLGGMAVIFLAMGGARLPVWGIPIQIFGLGALVPISCYSGRKATRHPLIQWGFYLFYPGHLVALWLIRNMIG